MEYQKEKNLQTCFCTYPDCLRKGICCECIKHHLAHNELPVCCFSKKAEETFDRSFKMFTKDQKLKEVEPRQNF
jgi:hypothetical protein